jgi:hypothetical protein
MMYARLTLLEIDTVRTSMAKALEHYKTQVVPLLRNQSGYLGAFVLATPEGKGAILSFWDTEEQAATEGDHTFYADAIGSFATFYRAAPGRERYEVVWHDDRVRLVR